MRFSVYFFFGSNFQKLGTTWDNRYKSFIPKSLPVPSLKKQLGTTWDNLGQLGTVSSTWGFFEVLSSDYCVVFA